MTQNGRVGLSSATVDRVWQASQRWWIACGSVCLDWVPFSEWQLEQVRPVPW